MSNPTHHQLKRSLNLLFLAVVALCCISPGAHLSAQAASSIEPGPKPSDVPLTLKPWIGEYGSQKGDKPGIVYLLGEKDGTPWILAREGTGESLGYKLVEKLDKKLEKGQSGRFTLGRDHTDNRRALILDSNQINRKITPDFDAPQQVMIHPVRAIKDLRTDALATSPPQETGNFREPELVELAPLDPAIHLDIRYATKNDFLGTPVYTQARAFLQKPAAEALVRALHKLQPLGYGLLIHDAYRPWYVTKIFWDATPPEGKIFVADPSQGSRHNRGCAADLTLYDLATGKPIEMPGTYDEMSPRSFPDYPGGTSLQRWHRDLLRRAMESEGFTVYEHEWWHFDYKDWKEYPILNIKFEDLHSGKGLASAK